MKCDKAELPTGDGKRVTAFICGARRSLPFCTSCKTRRAPLLCDYPVTRAGAAGTCDRAICGDCATNIGEEQDYCPPHARLAHEQGDERVINAKPKATAHREYVPMRAKYPGKCALCERRIRPHTRDNPSEIFYLPPTGNRKSEAVHRTCGETEAGYKWT